MKIRIPKEWYDILVKIAENKRVKLSDLIVSIISSPIEECLNLPYINSSTYKHINITINNIYTSSEIENKLRYFLFCR